MTIIITIAALALMLGVDVAATLGEDMRRQFAFGPRHQPVKIAVPVRPARRRINSQLPPI